jgi:hypothetical protein
MGGNYIPLTNDGGDAAGDGEVRSWRGLFWSEKLAEFKRAA